MPASTGPQGRDETRSERADRNLEELLQELRVALPGVQVLFAFLLIVPFNVRFSELSDLGEALYFGTLLCTAVATAILIAPGMNHRLEFRHGDKEHLVELSNRLTIIGMSLLAVAMLGAFVLVTDLVFGGPIVAVGGVVLTTTFVTLWYLTPLRRLRQLAREEREL
ncbi:MAG: DUF6328 family protein [Actinomycetota bacterium]|nr:DUF6328 family protein [Actinomycetota bacterium]